MIAVSRRLGDNSARPPLPPPPCISVSTTVCYEQPLNERMRLLLRLEFLFRQVAQPRDVTSVWDSQLALWGLSDILGLSARSDLRSELLKELERHGKTLNRLRQLPGVDETALAGVLQDIRQAGDRLHNLDNPALDNLRRHDLLRAIRQRLTVPGGVCEFDVPALHFWLQQATAVRMQQLADWLQPFQPVQQAVALVLRLVRDCALPRAQVARQGLFQQPLDSTAPNQLVRILLPAGGTVFPEVSGNRHRFAIRFLEQPDPGQRPVQTAADVEFQLVCCVI